MLRVSHCILLLSFVAVIHLRVVLFIYSEPVIFVFVVLSGRPLGWLNCCGFGGVVNRAWWDGMYAVIPASR